MPRIAISYRRSDSSATAGRIADRLAARYGQQSIFIDVQSVPVGTDFRKHIQETWSEIHVLIVVVGPRWLGVGEGTETPDRIHEPRGVVRIELEMALDQNIPIIPVLVGGAMMPPHRQLPGSIQAFSDLNAANIDDGRDFHPHMDRLIEAINRVAGEPGDQHPIADGGGANVVAQESDGRPLTPSLARLLRDIAISIFTLTVLHHVIVNVFDLDTLYLRILSFVAPFLLGVFAFWHTRWDAFAAFPAAGSVGLISVAAMTVSQGVNSGRPIMPATLFEWRESVEYVVSIAVSLFAGYLLARSLAVRAWKKKG